MIAACLHRCKETIALRVKENLRGNEVNIAKEVNNV